VTSPLDSMLIPGIHWQRGVFIGMFSHLLTYKISVVSLRGPFADTVLLTHSVDLYILFCTVIKQTNFINIWNIHVTVLMIE